MEGQSPFGTITTFTISVLQTWSSTWPGSAFLACDPSVGLWGFSWEEGLSGEGAGASSPHFCQILLHFQTCFASVQCQALGGWPSHAWPCPLLVSCMETHSIRPHVFPGSDHLHFWVRRSECFVAPSSLKKHRSNVWKHSCPFSCCSGRRSIQIALRL